VIGWVKVMPDKRKLKEIDRHIAEWRTLIATQKKRIADLQSGGHNAAGSITLLRELENSLGSMRHERGTIARRIERLGLRNPQGA
jgi:hypothetical protein